MSHDSLCEMAEENDWNEWYCCSSCTPTVVPEWERRCICDRLKKARTQGVDLDTSSALRSYRAGLQDALDAVSIGLQERIDREISEGDLDGLLSGLKYAQEKCISAVEALKKKKEHDN